MVTNATNCKDCIKADVCNIKSKFEYAIERIGGVNTSNEERVVHEAKDNAALVITVRCIYFAAKTGLLAR